MRKNNYLEKIYRWLVCALPVVLFFSYHPVISLGASESMNFELSLSLLWLVGFDLVAAVILIKKKQSWRDLVRGYRWWAWLGFLTLSVLWSSNSLRGILTAGILWLLCFAIVALFRLKDEMVLDQFRTKFWRVFFGATLLVCGWCFIQCFLDLVLVPREYSLMCAGCTYQNFGFPRPSGFAIEPQFMGNLLLAPTIVAVWFYFKTQNRYHLERKRSRGDNFYSLFCVFVFATTLFLTFSRGAIYAFVVGMMFMTGFFLGRERKKATIRVLKIWGVIITAFLMALNLQGIMAALSPTNDTYFGGVAKALNHLSLGVIDIRGEKQGLGSGEDSESEDALESEITGEIEGNDQKAPVENPVENSATFDGYVEESTDTRIKLNEKALRVWAKDWKTILFGVGLGGAGQALYMNGLTDSPKEIIQNQYVSLLLETGVVGVLLLILLLVSVIKMVVKKSNAIVVLTVGLAYGVSLLFFAGLPNALQIYLLPVVIMLLA